MITKPCYLIILNGVQLLIAFSSIISLLGNVIILLIFFAGYRQKAVKLIIIYMFIVKITGIYTGVKDFHIR